MNDAKLASATNRRVVITGAAGQISYSLIFRIANGELFGPQQSIELSLMDIEPMKERLEGVRMEILDCAFEQVKQVDIGSDAHQMFEGADCVFLVGAKPRGPGQERQDLLLQNANIFAEQGRALNQLNNPDVKVLVVGNPANTNALITAHHAPELDPQNITAMSRLDHNRMVSMAALKIGCDVEAIEQCCIWGNHSPTMFPDLHHATALGKPVLDCIPFAWYESQLIPQTQQRGAAVIQARGASSAASAAHAALCQMRDWLAPHSTQWRSMIVRSDGSYGIDQGLFSSFPVHCGEGRYRLIEGLEFSPFAQQNIANSVAELRQERQMVADLLN